MQKYNMAKSEYLNLYSWKLNERQLCDIELLLNGAFSPVKNFMSRGDYDSVLNSMRLKSGELWSMPIMLDVTEAFAKNLEIGKKISLRDKEGFVLASLTVAEIWHPDLNKEAKQIYGTTDKNHPGVNYLINHGNKVYISGSLKKISLPHHYDYKDIRHTPSSLRKLFEQKGWSKVVAFQTRNPLHRAHVEMTSKSLKDLDAKLLIHPVVGMTKPGDVNYYTRVRCYKHVMKKYPRNSAILSLLPLAMRMAGPREAIWHAQIRKNYGCSHIIIGRDHAGPGNDKDGNPFYSPYQAQELLKDYQGEIGIKVIPFKFMVYLTKQKIYEEIDKIGKKTKYQTISGTELRTLLDKGKEIPKWFSYPDVAKELKFSIPPLYERGLTIFFTGLSGSGKSTLANGLMIKLLEEGSRPVTLLDGDIVRSHLSSELGFSKKHRSINVRRIGYVASEITKNKGIAICAPIAPYEADRKFNREMITRFGGFIEIFVNTSLKKCEERDAKGLYALARKGLVKEFTGISDPYEKPYNSEIVVNSSGIKPEKLVERIYKKIKKLGYINK